MRTLRYPLMAVIILTFLPFVSSWPMAARVIYMAVIYIIGVACYSATSAPYGSFASVSTPVVKHRDEMAAGRGFGSTAGGIIVTFILPLVMYTTVKDSTGADKKILNGPVLIWVAIISRAPSSASAWIRRRRPIASRCSSPSSTCSPTAPWWP